LVKGLFLGSAACLAATVAARATDVPAGAKPVEYLTLCPQHGAGFWYVPATGTCIGSEPSRQQMVGHVWQLGGGLSVTLSTAEGGAAGAANSSRPPAGLGIGSPPLGVGPVSADNAGQAMPNLVGNLRVDRSWGSAMVKAALHQHRVGNDSALLAAVPCASGFTNGPNCGQAADEVGWAVGAGFAWNIPGLPGASLSLEASYAKGTIGHTARQGPGMRLWEEGRGIGASWGTDSVFRSGTSLELTDSWGIIAAGEHRWNPQWRTSIYGGYEQINYSGRAEAMICGRGAFAGLTALSNCGANFSWWNIGTRTQWSPHSFLDIGLDLAYARHNAALGITAADGARPAGAVTAQDQDNWSAFLRLQYNMRP
jgi:hypothetical protein